MRFSVETDCGTGNNSARRKRAGDERGTAGKMRKEKDTLAFIGSTFRSVWGIELLRLLVRQPHRAFTPDDIVNDLRASTAIVAQGVGVLEAAGLAEQEPDGSIRYRPASPELAIAAARAIQLYETRPDRVRRAIVANVSPGIAAFADAFRLAKDD